MVNFILIIICMIAGMVFRSTKSIHPDAHKGINTWIIYIALPAVSFKYIPAIRWSHEMIMPALAPFIMWLGAWALVLLYTRRKHYSPRTRSTLELASGYSNTSFIGFPMITAFYGEQNLSIAIICDQVTFLILSTLGIASVLKGSARAGQKLSASFMLKRLVTFPPFIGCASALLLSQFFDLSIAQPLFDKLAATVAPLALFSVGLQLRFNGWKTQIKQINLSIFYKLLIAPALVLIVGLFLKIKGMALNVAVMEAAMPTLITGGIVAEQYRLNSKLINLIIGISIIVSFITIVLWFFILEYVNPLI